MTDGQSSALCRSQLPPVSLLRAPPIPWERCPRLARLSQPDRRSRSPDSPNGARARRAATTSAERSGARWCVNGSTAWTRRRRVVVRTVCF